MVSNLDVLCKFYWFWFILCINWHYSFLDKPTVTIERHTSSELEDGQGSLTLTCMSKSNPPGRTLWYKKGESASSPQYKEQLVFDPITKQQAGDYVCAAENSVGRSEEAVTSVQVLCKFLSLTSFSSPSYKCQFFLKPAFIIFRWSRKPLDKPTDRGICDCSQQNNPELLCQCCPCPSLWMAPRDSWISGGQKKIQYWSSGDWWCVVRGSGSLQMCGLQQYW